MNLVHARDMGAQMGFNGVPQDFKGFGCFSFGFIDADCLTLIVPERERESECVSQIIKEVRIVI